MSSSQNGIDPQFNPSEYTGLGIPPKWALSVNVACTEWLRHRGLISSFGSFGYSRKSEKTARRCWRPS